MQLAFPVRRMVVLAAAAVTVLAGRLWAASPPDPLWQKAVSLAGRAKEWVPGVTVFRLELLDEQGRRQEEWISRMRLTRGEDGEPVTQVENATHNGKDVTARERENQTRRNEEARRKGRQSGRMGDDPFDPALQDGALVQALGENRVVDGRQCAMYSFTVKRADGGEMKGTAALDQANGAPVEASYTVSPLPTGVQSMTTLLRYSAGPAGDGFVREMTVEGRGGVLFLRKTFRTTISLDGYWPRQGT
jgi:hypothetical protein